MTTFRYKRGDTRPALTRQLRRNGDPIDLSDADDVVLYVDDNDGGLLLDASMTIVDAEAGRVRYAWASDDLDVEPNDYDAEIVIEWGDGRDQTVPESDFLRIIIDPPTSRP